MNKSQLNVPKLRFKGFDDEWKFTNLNNTTYQFDYGMNLKSKEFDGKNKYIRITDIDNSHKYIKTNNVSPDGILEDKYLLDENDICIARTGATVGKHYIYTKDDGDKVYFAGYLIRLKDKKMNNFIFFQLQTKTWDIYVKQNSERSGQPGINVDQIKNFEFFSPLITEQQKIVKFFMLLDKQIELWERKLQLNELIKKYYLSQILIINSNIPKLRFKEFKDEWVNKKIADILIYEQPTKYMVENENYFNDKKLLPVLTAGKTFILGYTNNYENSYDKGEVIIFDDFTLDMRFINFDFKIKSSAIKLLTSIEENLKFIFESMLNIKAKPIGHNRHYINIFKNFILKIPLIKEQEKIVIFLNILENNMQSIKKIGVLLKHKKQFYLQNLFI